MAEEALKVELGGLREFRLELKKVHTKGGKAIGDANFDIADGIVTKAKSLAKGQPGATGKLTEGNAMRATRKQKGAIVALGGSKKTAWAVGGEFGSLQYSQFQPWRGNQWQPSDKGVGYALHPTIAANLKQIEQDYLDTLENLSHAFR